MFRKLLLPVVVVVVVGLLPDNELLPSWWVCLGWVFPDCVMYVTVLGQLMITVWNV